MVGEMTDETNQARAFPIISLAWNLWVATHRVGDIPTLLLLVAASLAL